MVKLMLLAAALVAALGAAEAPPLLLPDRSWFSQVARVRQRPSALSPGSCEALSNELSPGMFVKGYELVERSALLGVCSLQAPGISPVATRAADAMVVPARHYREWEEERIIRRDRDNVCPLIPPPPAEAARHQVTSQVAPLELIEGPVLEYQVLMLMNLFSFIFFWGMWWMTRGFVGASMWRQIWNGCM